MPPERPRSTILLCVLVAVLVAAAWSPALGNGYAWDDRNLFVENPGIRQPGALWAAFSRDFWDNAAGSGYYRPLITASYIADDSLWGIAQPAGWHATNVVAHAAAAGVLCALLLALGFAPLGAGGAALLFGLLPALAESVAWISGRTDVFAALGVLACLLADVKGRHKLAVLALVGALLCKETAALAPIMALGLAWAGGQPLPEAARRRWLLGAALAVYAVVRVAVLGDGGLSPDEGERSIGLGARVLAMPHIIGLLVAPWRARVEYGGALPVTPLLQSAAAGTALVGALAWGAWKGRDRLAAALLACAALALLPSFAVALLRGILGDRFLYLPAAFLIPAGVRLLRGQPWRGGAIAALAAGWALGVWLRVPLWESEATLFAAAAEQPPVSERVNLNFGIALYDDGQWSEAQRRLRQAVDATGHAKALYMLGLMYEAVGCDDLAIGFWGQAARQEPFHPGSANNLGALLREVGQREASIAVLSDAVARSRYPDPILQANLALSQAPDAPTRPLGQCPDPMVIDQMVRDAPFLNRRALDRLRAQRYDQAERLIAAALHAEPGMVAALLNRAQLLVLTGKPAEAVALLEDLQPLHPDDARIGRLLERTRAAIR